MKKIEFKVGRFWLDKIETPIRNRRDIILLLLETLKLFDGCQENVDDECGKIIVCIDKMSRVFYETEEKCFSFLFPFSIEQRDDHYRIYDNRTDFEIDNRIISLLISIFNRNGFLGQSLEKTMDYILDSAGEYEYGNIDEIWRIIFKLWYMEDGYIRYDHDVSHENADMHPLYHLDINYSSGVTYKFGLKRPIQMEEFRNLLDTGTECAYVSVN